MTKKRGIALITVLLVSVTLLAIVGVGLGLGSNGVLFVSQAHKRNVALSAAEAGVYDAMVALQVNKNHSGTVEGTLSESGAEYTYTLNNQLSTARTAEVVSTGEFGGVKRTVRVVLEPDSLSFSAIDVEGKVYVFDQAYVNGVTSVENPVPRPGRAHSEYSNPSANSFRGVDFEDDGDTPQLMVTGDLTTLGSFDGGLQTIQKDKRSGESNSDGYSLDVTEMTNGSFTSTGTLSSGTLSGNTEVNPSGVLTVTGKVIVPKGVKLVINGDVRFEGGLSGDGEVVVHGDVLIKTDSNLDPSVQEGIKLHSDGAVLVTHPQAEVDVDDGDIDIPMNGVADFFASMPANAVRELSVDIPVSAPKDGDFFTWYAGGSDASSSEYQLWYDGDGTDLHPGLSTETKNWLNQLNPTLAQDIADWAN